MSKCTTSAKEKKYLQHYTCFKSYQQFREILDFVLPDQDRKNIIYWNTAVAKANLVDTNLLFGCNHAEPESSGSESEDEDPVSVERTREHKLTLEDEFLLFMMRLKLGLSCLDLSIRFCVSEGTVNTILITWLNFLYVHLGHLKIWPHRNVLLSNIPKEFKEKYPNNIVFIDATELNIQTPSSLLKQSQSYSTYKSSNTLKGLEGVGAKGDIMFVSQLYTGSVSDKEITVRSGFLNLLENKLSVNEILPGDSIMADKGFDIEPMLKKMGLCLNIPPFLGETPQFDEADVLKTQTIAQHRIHVERAIGKVRRFGIFSSHLPVSMLGAVNQLWTVCCILSNFMDHILY